MDAYQQTAAAFTSLHQQVMERHEERMMELRRQVDDLTFRVAYAASMAGLQTEAVATTSEPSASADVPAESFAPAFRIGQEVRVIAPRFPPDANRGKTGRIVAAFDFPATQAHYHVEIDGVVYDYDADELEEPGQAIARALAGFTVVTSGTGLPTDRAA